MKNNKQCKVWNLNELEFEAIASFLLCDIDEVKRIYENYKFEGLGVILLSNCYLLKNKKDVGKLYDLKKIISSYYPKGMKILKYLFSSHFYKKEGPLYYPKEQLVAINRYKNISKKYIEKECTTLEDSRTVYPPDRYINPSYITKALCNMIVHVNQPLPQNIKDEISGYQSCDSNFNVENFYRLMNAYMSIDHSFIGFYDMIDIQLKILHKDKADVMKVLKNSSVWVYDSIYKIIYDPYQRVAHNLNADPSWDEVKEAGKRRLGRYRIILNLN